MVNSQFPKVAVLLAAYNGEKYIQEQIESIITQTNVNITIYISIDTSTDRTLEICKNLKDLYKNIHIINYGQESFGSAGKNFYYLIKNVDFNEFDFIAFSDQDDIWKPSKIIRGIQVLKEKKVSGYSSDVECFWNDGSKKNKIIKKSYPQKKYDYLFEPAGPGCTYILNQDLATALKSKISSLKTPPFHHDWFVYAFARENKFHWHIDTEPNILYRQHTNNQIGANHGISQKIKRIKTLKNKEFKKEIIEIAISLNTPQNIDQIRKKVIKNPFNYRRKNTEAIFIFFFCVIGWI